MSAVFQATLVWTQLNRNSRLGPLRTQTDALRREQSIVLAQFTCPGFPGPSTLFGAGVSRGKVWTPGGGTKGCCPMSAPFPPLPRAALC